MKHLIHLWIAAFVLLFSCENSKYSDEEKAQLEEAQQLHNEAMATFSETKGLLADLTEARAELVKVSGIASGDSAMTGNSANSTTKKDTSASSSDKQNAGNEALGGTTMNAQNASDTLQQKAQKALENLNSAQGEFMEWVRNIYTVPGIDDSYDEEKMKDKPAIGMDYNAPTLSSEMEFKKMPEGASIDEIHKKQEEMKEEIQQIQENIKEAIKNARMASLDFN